MKQIIQLPNLEYLKSILNYDPNTGYFTWKISIGKRIKCGDSAGSWKSSNYKVIKIMRVVYMAHRIAFYMHYKKEPATIIDHINGKKWDNSIKNLREATVQQNAMNSKSLFSDNTSGYKGVSKNRKKWRVFISINKKQTHIGNFNSKEKAAEAAKQARLKHYGEFCSDNRL